VLRSAWHDLEGLVTFGRRLLNTPPLSIEGSIGPHRVWCHSSVDLDDIRAIRAMFGGTINDIVLAACAAGYRALLLKRGENVDRAVVRSLVPVSVRAADAHGVLDNRVSAMLYELPVRIDSPIERLSQVQQDMAALKGSHMAEAGEALTTIGGIFPPIALGAISRTAMRVMHVLPQRSINTVTTNVPGPQFPLYCLGREMIAYYPFVPISHGVRIGTAILSYNGHLAFGVTGDFDSASDIDVLADAIRASVLELRAFSR
jgi:diacylglycerol O-acyltransferase / wax synthase